MEQQFEYAGFWIRVGAIIIDAIWMFLITWPLLILVYGWDYFTSDEFFLIAGPGDFFISWVLPGLLTVLFWIWKQATPGKMIVSIKIIDAKTGGKPSTRQFIGRYLAYFLSSIPLCLGCLWVAFDHKKQGWHDKLAGTLVVYNTREP